MELSPLTPKKTLFTLLENFQRLSPSTSTTQNWETSNTSRRSSPTKNFDTPENGGKENLRITNVAF
jgi:hypothetical protein